MGVFKSPTRLHGTPMPPYAQSWKHTGNSYTIKTRAPNTNRPQNKRRQAGYVKRETKIVAHVSRAPNTNRPQNRNEDKPATSNGKQRLWHTCLGVSSSPDGKPGQASLHETTRKAFNLLAQSKQLERNQLAPSPWDTEGGNRKTISPNRWVFSAICALPASYPKKNCVRFSICACHPCAGAMLIFSVSFQF